MARLWVISPSLAFAKQFSFSSIKIEKFGPNFDLFDCLVVVEIKSDEAGIAWYWPSDFVPRDVF